MKGGRNENLQTKNDVFQLDQLAIGRKPSSAGAIPQYIYFLFL